MLSSTLFKPAERILFAIKDVKEEWTLYAKGKTLDADGVNSISIGLVDKLNQVHILSRNGSFFAEDMGAKKQSFFYIYLDEKENFCKYKAIGLDENKKPFLILKFLQMFDIGDPLKVFQLQPKFGEALTKDEMNNLQNILLKSNNISPRTTPLSILMNGCAIS